MPADRYGISTFVFPSAVQKQSRCVSPTTSISLNKEERDTPGERLKRSATDYGINNDFHFCYRMDWKPSQPGMFPNCLFVFRDMNAVDLIGGNKGLYPMVWLLQADNHVAACLRNSL